jgi:hypothetical protein
MTRCLDEATLQSYFDGELSGTMMESATLHLASCSTCAAAARVLTRRFLATGSGLHPQVTERDLARLFRVCLVLGRREVWVMRASWWCWRLA